MRKKMPMILSLIAALLLLAACGGDDGGGETEGGTEASAAKGETLYTSTTIGASNAPGCVTCHSVTPTDEPLQPSPVGPSHYGVADRAGDYVEGMSAEEYLRESIVAPDAHVVEGFAAGVMYPNYGEDLSEQEIASLVAYLMTLEGD